MFFLPWWSYVLIGTAAFTCALLGQWLANLAQLGVEKPDDGPFPCFEHMGTDENQRELWCWLLQGHEGRHEDQSELPETVFTREWPDEENIDVTTAADEDDVFLPVLPQRLSKVPVQTEHNDCLKVLDLIPCSATFSDPCPGDCWGETGCTRNT